MFGFLLTGCPVLDLASAFATLFVVIDPPGMAPIFLGLTAGMDRPLKRKIAIEACIIAFLVLAGAALFGTVLLNALASACLPFASPAGCCCSPSPSRWCSTAASAAMSMTRRRGPMPISPPFPSPSP